MLRFKIPGLFLAICCLFLSNSFSQIKHAGIPRIRNYERNEFQAGRQIWDIVQNEHDVIYFANNSGVLEYDGAHWNLYPLSNRSVVRAVAVDDTGKVYAGGFNEFGYLRIHSDGSKSYESFQHLIPEDHQDFGEIWKIYVTDAGVLFQSFTTIFLYKDGQIKILDHNKNFHFAFYRGGELYISEWEKGLMKYNGQQFEQVEGGEFFAGERKIWSMTQLEKNRFLLGTQNDGMFIYHGDTIKPWDNETSQFLRNNQLFSTTRISENYFAFGSIQNGLILSNRQGKILQHINKEHGLQNNTILATAADQGKNLWLGLDNGIDYLEINSPISYLGEGHRIEGTGYVSAIHNGNLYLGTNQGLFYSQLEKDTRHLEVKNHFELIDNTKGQVWNLTEIDGQLFCGHNKGALIIEGGESRQITDMQGGWDFLEVPENPGYILQGSYNGLVRIKRDDGQWQFDQKVAGFSESSRIDVFDNKGNLWISHGYKGVYKLRLNESIDRVVDVTHYDQDDGLPSDQGNTVFELEGEIYVSTNQGVYRYVFLADQFEQDTAFDRLVGDQQVSALRRDLYGNIWYFSNFSHEIGMVKAKDAPSAFNNIEVLEKLDNQYVPAFEHINVIDSNNIIIGTVNGFAHFDPSVSMSLSKSFHTLIRECSFFGKKDTANYYNLMDFTGNTPHVDIYPLRSLRIRFASTFYEDLDNTRYSFILEGYDEEWSAWNSRNTKEYTNLPPDEYTFKVKAKNVYGRISNVSDFEFVVLPPWYQTVWAYMGYVVVIIGLIIAAVRNLNKMLDKEKRKVEEKNLQEMRRQREEYEKEQLAMQNRIMQLENEKLQADIVREEADKKIKNKELTAQALHINRKNDILNYIKKELDKVTKSINPDARFQLKLLNKKIDQDLSTEDDWKKFEQYFDEVQGEFISRLKESYPQLSPKDLKLCAYLRMNLSSKEIASLMNITPRGVEIHRYRLRKKLELEREVNLVDFLLDI